MNKAIALLFVLIICCSGCAVYDKDALKESKLERKYNINTDISLTIVEAPLSEPIPDYLTVVFTNKSNKDYRYSADVYIDIKLDDIWYIVPRDGYGYAKWLGELAPYSSCETVYYIGDYNIKCTGLYRFGAVNYEHNDAIYKRKDMITFCEFIIESSLLEEE